MDLLPGDYYLEDGKMVFTAQYLRRRGYCCGSGCRHCPYEYANVPPERRAQLLQRDEPA
ncbi:MAG TPA: DUF5522 domain-containing protein [Candidatus Nitrosotenuis sp.]|nr:DUF5522 domain-containing protein [Candidatus Nitrosotenuis sp.]